MMSKNVFRALWRDHPNAGDGKYHPYIKNLGEEAIHRAINLYQLDVDYLFGESNESNCYIVEVRILRISIVCDHRDFFPRIFHDNGDSIGR
jgi:hypothetical protein